MGNMFGAGHAPCTLKTSFRDSKKSRHIVAATKNLNISSLPKSTCFFIDSQKTLLRLTNSSLFPIWILYIVGLALVLNIAELLLAERYAITNQYISCIETLNWFIWSDICMKYCILLTRSL